MADLVISTDHPVKKSGHNRGRPARSRPMVDSLEWTKDLPPLPLAPPQ